MQKFKENSTSSRFLDERERVNRERSSFDFEEWFRQSLGMLGNKTSILDIFCGRGKQLKELRNTWPSSNLTGVDISNESIRYINQHISNINAICMPVEEFVKSTSQSEEKWDLITAFYGLYYALNQQEFISGLANSITQNGHIIICGPYGDNNAQLYKLIETFQEIDKFVLHTSTDYMDTVVIPELEKYGFGIRVENRVNSVGYENSDEVIRYLNSTTFFVRENIKEVKEVLDDHFRVNQTFMVEKHIKMLVCEKL